MLTLNLIDGLLSTNGFYLTHPQFAHIEDGFILLLGPLLYFYTLSVVYKDFRFKNIFLIHFVPFIIFTAFLLTYFHSLSREEKLLVENAVVSQELPVGFYVIVTAFYFHIGLYIAVSVQHISFYRNRIKQEFSDVQKINLDWLLFLLISIVVILVVSFAQVVVSLTIGREGIVMALLIVIIFLFVFVNMVVLRGLKHPAIFSGISYQEVHSKNKNYKEKLQQAEREKIVNGLKVIMNRDRPFLKADLSLENLADKLDISPKKLSQVLNEDFAQSFFEFVNTYRIAEAERIIKESHDPGLTVLEVMYMSGFNSKSSFNTVFKKKTGLTPTAYRQAYFSAL